MVQVAGKSGNSSIVLHRAAELWHVTSPAGSSGTIRRGRLGDRFRFDSISDVGLAVDESTGRIIEASAFSVAKAHHPGARVIDHGDGVIVPGFIDGHLHFPQLDVMGSHGKHLIQWLDTFIFPAEARFSDRSVAESTAARFTKELAANGVTMSVAFSSVHPVAADVLFDAFEKSGLRAVVGKTSMDVNAPASVVLECSADIEAQEMLIKKWHGRQGRLFYAVTPRFVLTSSPTQMKALADLHRRHPDTFIQTHISECEGEMESVAAAFPNARDYLSIYEDYGLINDRTLLGHGIWLTASERERVAGWGATVVHCPTSNAFFG